jgi:hypothetical protein
VRSSVLIAASDAGEQAGFRTERSLFTQHIVRSISTSLNLW